MEKFTSESLNEATKLAQEKILSNNPEGEEELAEIKNYVDDHLDEFITEATEDYEKHLKAEFPVLRNISSIGENEGVKKEILSNGWKRFFENKKYVMDFKIRDFKIPGGTIKIPNPGPGIFAGTEAEAVAKRNPELFKERNLSFAGGTARAGLYVVVDMELANELHKKGIKIKYENIGGMVSVSEYDNFEQLDSSDFPEDAKKLIKEHFAKQLEK